MKNPDEKVKIGAFDPKKFFWGRGVYSPTHE